MKNQLDTPKQKRTALPVVALAAVVVFAAAVLFGIGFYVAGQVDQAPTKQAGPAFDRSDYREQQPAFVKMPDELP